MNKLMKPDRLCILTDGIYAIVITLLVLDLKPPQIPGISNRELMQDLAALLPNFKAYIVAFTILAKFWIKHHNIFNQLKACDSKMVFLNFMHILFISLVPFTSSLVGRYRHDEVSIILFIANLCLVGFFMSSLKWYALRDAGQVDERARKVWASEPWYRRFTYTFITVAAIPCSFLSHDLALGLTFIAPFAASHVERKWQV